MQTFCSSCAFALPPGARFCSRCGSENTLPAPTAPLRYQGVPLRDPLEGISGWLILIAISLVFTPFTIVRNAISIDLPALSHGTLGGSLGGLLFLVKDVAILSALILLNWLFYTKNRLFPKLMIAFHLGLLGIHVLEHVALAASLPQSAVRSLSRPVFGSLLSCAIWIPYLLISRRVKATFVH
jgi:hypothetical protein